ncbi:glutathione S-transferase family protein [Chitinolyticbacter albus]|uniref:glutathione S-transferase family protein n=1 Tax=Chitinolyticbacter albus TaxID=2961951 RepID=UPI00210AC268|nr:glutathione S-transferase family protein [Chitinolyticbacter albus]
MHPVPVLFYGVPQGCSFGSIVALEWLGQPYRLCRIEMLDHPWPAAYAAINPLNQTPALLLEEGEALSESLAILLNIGTRGIARGLGFYQGTPEADRLNEVLAYLNSDFFAAFGPLWAAYEMQDADEATRAVLQRIGNAGVAKALAHVEALLGRRPWLAGAQRTVADAYFAGVARWAEYFPQFDLALDYPNLRHHLDRLRADPAVQFAMAIEAGEPATSSGRCLGHVMLDALHEQRARLGREGVPA